MSAVLPTSASNPRVWRPGTAQWVVLSLSLAATIAAFYPVLLFMVQTWGAVEEYSYGYFIPVITAFLIWQRSDYLRREPLVGSFWGLAIIGAALLLRWIGDASAIRLIGQYGFVVAVFGISVCSIGWRGTRIIGLPLAMLFFMIPLPQFVLREVSLSLQLLSSELGVALIRLFGISVFLEGNVIDLGSYKLQVVEACNGLRYLFPLMVLGVLAAYFYRGEMWKRVFLVVSTVPLTIVVNSLRIGLIGVTVEYWGQSMAEGLVHDFEGWFMFMICQALLMVEMAVLARIGREPRKFGEVFWIELPAARPRAARTTTHPLAVASLTGAVLLAAQGVLALATPDRVQTVPARTAFTEFPLHLPGQWEGRPDRLEADVLATLAVDDYLIANYQQQGQGAWVNFYAAWYDTQSSGESTHSPRTCIPGGGWSILNLRETSVPLAQGRSTTPLPINRAIIQKGEHRQLVYYWFSQRGRTLTNEYAVKWYVLQDSILRNRSDGALIRLVTPIFPGEAESTADRRLADFIATVEPRLAAYVPH